MQTLLRMLTVAGVVCAATMTVVHAQQVPSPTTAAEVPWASTRHRHDQSVRADRWGAWPTCGVGRWSTASNRFARRSPKRPNPACWTGVVPVALQPDYAMLTGYISTRVSASSTCPNQDVVYGAGFVDAGQGAHRLPGPGFRGSLLGLRALRCAHRRVLRDRQAIRHQTRLLSDGRPELEGRDASRHHGSGALVYVTGRLPLPRIFMDDTADGPRGHPAGAQPGRLLPAIGVRREDEDHRLEQAPSFPGAEAHWQR